MLIALIVGVIIVILFASLRSMTIHSQNAETLRHLQKTIHSLSDAVHELIRQQQSAKEPPPVSSSSIAEQPEPVASEETPESTIAEEPVIAPTLVPEPITHAEPAKTSSRRDLEKFIGENVANKIGIGVFVLGIAFFIRYAIDKNWIGEAARVLIGGIAGIILLTIAHRFRNTYRSFSSVLVGGALTVFYFSIGFAFHNYHLVGQTAAFLLMVGVAALGVVFSLWYNRQELALLATIGGFITPFLVSTGNGNYVVLFTYLLILNSAIVTLSWFKRWPLIRMAGLVFTIVIYGAWMVVGMWAEQGAFPAAGGFLFATLFFFLFLAMFTINQFREKSKFSAADFVLLLLTNTMYAWAGYVLLDELRPELQGFFLLGLGSLNLLIAISCYRQQRVDRNFTLLSIGLGIGFLSIAIPVLFTKNLVGLCWAFELTILFSLYLNTGMKLLKTATDLLTALVIGNIVFSWAGYYGNAYDFLDSARETHLLVPVVFNTAFITAFYGCAALFIYKRLLKRDRTDANRLSLVSLAAVLLAFLTGAMEIGYQFANRFAFGGLTFTYLRLYAFLFVTVLVLINRKKNWNYLLTFICLLFYLVTVVVEKNTLLWLLDQDKAAWFMAHPVASLLLLGNLAWVALLLKTEDARRKREGSWWLAGIFVFILSMELQQVFIWLANGSDRHSGYWENLFSKAGLSILWAVCSFVIMWLGMRGQFRPLRLASLALFTITLIKLFAYDISDMQPGAKIVAFLLLGILLLIVSFMYQRLRNIVMDNKIPEEK